jgi:hypothetical protein
MICPNQDCSTASNLDVNNAVGVSESVAQYQSTLRGALNNVATQVKPCKPWEFKPNVPADVLVDKNTYKAWRANAQTIHLVFTGYEGLNPDIRVNSKTNPVRRMHAIVVDYDAYISDHEFNNVLDHCPADFRPTWIARSPSGKAARLVYMFERPVPIDCEPLLEAFLSLAKANLRLTTIFPAFDDAAWKNVSTLYDVGSEWKHLGDHVLSKSCINYWLSEAAKKTAWSKLGDIHIPLDVIADEITAKGWEWPGEFVENARGPVFWDGGSNPTSCIVTPNGMVCFSREEGFYKWADIFGVPFVRKFQQEKIGGAIDGVWFDGNKYYRKINDRWVTVAKEDYRKYLKVRKRLSDEKRGNECSEVEQAEMDVQELRRVSGVVPILYDPRDVVERDGERLLNISYVKALAPADERGEWGEKFPWIAKFLDTLFDPAEQLRYFLAWLKRFYGSARQGSLERGHNIFLVGGVNAGKTLLGLRIIGTLLGGSADASEFVVKQSEFNKLLSERALWRIDDGQIASDPKAHAKFGEMVKKLAANPTLNYRKMYSDSMDNEWSGRLFVTLNDDNYSLQMIPDLTMSIEDKIMIFKVANIHREWPPRHILEPRIAAELPHFARWLLEWTTPAELMVGGRFGVKGYIHEGLRNSALHSGQVGDLLELVDLWIQRSQPMEKLKSKTWSGTASGWWTEVMQDEMLEPLVQKFTVRQIARKFVEASRIEGSRIKVLGKRTGPGNRYEICLTGEDENTARPILSFDPAANNRPEMVSSAVCVNQRLTASG